MTLPLHFSSPEEYFKEFILFLQEYQYLYKHPNTHILVDNVLDNILIDKFEEINISTQEFHLRGLKNEYITIFLAKLEKFTPNFKEFMKDAYLDDVIVPLSPKKKHEIMYLAKEIKNVCAMVECGVVVDFGSGLGYLDQRLHETTNYKILGIECNENFYVSAKKRQRKYHENSIDRVKYVKHKITVDSCEKIEEYINDKFGENDFCITGLHACADLTVDALNIFIKMATAKCLVIMPCCYHKIEEVNGKFTNFPLSNCLKNLYHEHKAYEYLNVPFLRLGTQPPNWKEKIEDLVYNLLARAVLQLYVHKHNCKLKRNKRKAVRTKTLENGFEFYAKEAITGFTLIKNEPNDDEDNVENLEIGLEELNSIWRTLTDVIFKKAGIYIQMQNYLQRVIENFILYDRIVYLKENGLNTCEFRKIFDDKLSPRCLALIAFK